MAPLPVVAAAVVFLAASTVTWRGAGAVEFLVTNNALSTGGGRRFEREVGAAFSKKVMASASAFVWQIFRQPSAADRKDVPRVHLFVDMVPGIAYTSGADIHVGSDYVGNVTGDVRASINETLHHEIGHVWQWDGRGTARTGLIEGIADYVVLKAGLGTWAKPGKGERWDQGYDATALFLDYCGGFRPTFVADLNRLMKVAYTDDYFFRLLGKTVDQLWADYKAKYGGGGSDLAEARSLAT